MPLADPLYDAAVRIARAATPMLARGEGKVARAFRGRSAGAGILEAWATEGRVVDRPLLWLHAPSVGEGLQARAVLEALRVREPALQVVYTHTSPSAEALARDIEADVAAYLPWDAVPTARRLLTRLRTDLLCFTKTEVWPGVTRVAAERGVPVALVGGTLPEGAGRLTVPGRFFLGPTFRRLSAVGAIAVDDAERFQRLGVPGGHVVVTGDPGIDSAARRAGAADPAAAYLAPFHRAGGPILVAGSTWPADEAVLVPAATRVRRSAPGTRLVVAPHEPTPAHLEPLESSLSAAGWRVRRLGALEEAGQLGDADAILVDRVGVLAHLYTVATCAWVGGGFGADGLHSVLEPAAAGVPVVFGPRHRNARAAGDLLEAGAAQVVREEDGAAEALARWLADAGAAEVAGERGTAYIRTHRGAADRSADLLARLLHGSSAR